MLQCLMVAAGIRHGAGSTDWQGVGCQTWSTLFKKRNMKIVSWIVMGMFSLCFLSIFFIFGSFFSNAQVQCFCLSLKGHL
jgi:hypothetical protein